MPLPNGIKIFQSIKKLWSAQEFGVEICSGEITSKKQNRIVFLACDIPTWPDMCPYQILLNYRKQYGSYDLYKLSVSGEIII